ncbi:MAG TPA: alpha/beta fold hydrolase [Chloroflexota bacterium]|nr:alpha/beta fold hydrolase [Chloroflexota bacterium]
MSVEVLTEESTSRYTRAGDVRLHYHEAGSGPAVVLLHGGGPGATAWGNYARNVAAFAAAHRVLLPDLPQFGKSDSPVLTEDRPLANARILTAFFDAVGVERASLVGNSMGGATALELAIHYPERVDKLVLMGSGGAGPSLFAVVPTEGDRLLRENFQHPTFDSMRRLIQVMVYDASFLTDELVQKRLESALNPAHREARRQSFRKPGEPRAELERVQAPTLIVWGREDRVNPFDQALGLLQGIRGAQLHVYTECGHWAQLEKADAFNRLVLDFLDH